MSTFETSSGTLLWSDMVEQEENEREGIIIFPYENCKDVDEDEQSPVRPESATRGSKSIQVDRETSQAFVPPVDSQAQHVKKGQTHTPVHASANSGYARKPRNHSYTSAAYTSSYSGYDQRQWRPNQPPPSVHRHFQNTTTGQMQAPEFHPKQMKSLNQQVDNLRNRLQQKNTFLTQEREKRIAAEKDCNLQKEKLKELEKTLNDERQLKVVCVQELSRMIKNLHKSTRALEAADCIGDSRCAEVHMLVLDDLDNLKKQLQDMDNGNLEAVDRPRTQDVVTDNQQEDIKLHGPPVDSNESSNVPQKQMNKLLFQVHNLTNRLKRNDILLYQEKGKSLAAENECALKREQLQEVESLLKEEYHRRIVSEKELKWCKRTIDSLRLPAMPSKKGRANKSRAAQALDEFENMKKQLQDQTKSNIELTSKVKAQEEEIERLEWMVATLTVQIKSASETSNHQADVTEDLTKAPAAEQALELQSVSVQTEHPVPEDVTESKEISTQTEALVTVDISEQNTASTQIEASDTEQVFDLKGVSNQQLETSESEEILPDNKGIVPEPEEACASETYPQTLKKPSLWRRFKKALTPASRRQYKSKRQL